MRVDNRVSQVPPVRTHEVRNHKATTLQKNVVVYDVPLSS
jgi:hypothetical protein